MNRHELKQKELEIALENRAFELQLFWQRTNYFLVLITALGIGAFSISNIYISTVISFFATISSYFWFRTNLGSKFWQESWESEVALLSEELGIRSFVKSVDDFVVQVKDALEKDDKTYLRSWVDKQTLKKYSVTYYMILLSLYSTITWSVISVLFVFEIVEIAELGATSIQFIVKIYENYIS